MHNSVEFYSPNIHFDEDGQNSSELIEIIELDNLDFDKCYCSLWHSCNLALVNSYDIKHIFCNTFHDISYKK